MGAQTRESGSAQTWESPQFGLLTPRNKNKNAWEPVEISFLAIFENAA